MMILIDIGNSRLKWGIENETGIQFKESLDYRLTNFSDRLIESWGILPKPSKIAISSVSTSQLVSQLQNIFRQLWDDITVIIAHPSAQGFGVKNAYPQFDRLGTDRWLTLLALRHIYPGDSCVVDCGTAITLDVINRHGQHLGGVISPGLKLMQQALIQGTEIMSFSHYNYKAGLANATGAAIYSGVLFSAVGLIEHLLNAQPGRPQLVLTGGDAELIAAHIKGEFIVEPNLVLKGLSVYCSGDKSS